LLEGGWRNDGGSALVRVFGVARSIVQVLDPMTQKEFPPPPATSEELACRIGERERRIALRIVRDSHDADDVVQDARVKVLENGPPPAWTAPPEHWLGRITRNLSLSKRRREIWARRAQERYIGEQEVAAAGKSPRGWLLRKETALVASCREEIHNWPAKYLENCRNPDGPECQHIAKDLAYAADCLIKDGELPERGAISETARRYALRYRENLKKQFAPLYFVVILIALGREARAAVLALLNGAAVRSISLGAVLCILPAIAAWRACSAESHAPHVQRPGVVGGAHRSKENPLASAPSMPMVAAKPSTRESVPDVADQLLQRLAAQKEGDLLLHLGAGLRDLKLLFHVDSSGFVNIQIWNKYGGVTPGMCGDIFRSACDFESADNAIVIGCVCGNSNNFNGTGPEFLLVGWVDEPSCGILSGVAWRRDPDQPSTEVAVGTWGFMSKGSCSMRVNPEYPISKPRTWFDVDAERVRVDVCSRAHAAWLACDPTWRTEEPADITAENRLRRGAVWWKKR
jgi:hypothetical protein